MSTFRTSSDYRMWIGGQGSLEPLVWSSRDPGNRTPDHLPVFRRRLDTMTVDRVSCLLLCCYKFVGLLLLFCCRLLTIISL